MFIATAFFFSDLQFFVVLVRDAEGLAHLLDVVLAGRGGAASDGFLAAAIGILPSRVDVTPRKNRIRIRVLPQALGEFSRAGGHIRDVGLEVVVDTVTILVLPFIFFPVNELL